MKLTLLLFLLFNTTLFAQDDDSISLEEVNIKNKSKYITLKSYFRSWIIKNDTLTDYVDGEAIYLYPKEEFKNKLNVKKNVLQYRNFYDPNKELNKKIIQISFMNDYYGYWNIPEYRTYKTVKITDNSYDILNRSDSVIGNYYTGNEIDSLQTSSNYSYKKNIKVAFTKKEKWYKNKLPLSFSFIQNETLLDDKKKIVTEIFISKPTTSLNFGDLKKYKLINFNKSKYHEEYWTNYLRDYPLSLEFQEKLKHLKLRKD
ncbi:hypothetical protein [Algoriella sp.]|uniref:hypothetical protein n=1 Tax=Algoriella sp. TaxID=1872434 RepID=UPI001B15CDD9|nr:hypothetical protein [Algoriella sp.]MBO6212414.1 hypothetical protein [Algoriella sp.]